ncbi:hypothetical protein FO519_000147 [Halicephalobus sp. NKZ332]|nr:hypothetical protein FO519_000147 [Halicephalobus sp. NKZ332]
MAQFLEVKPEEIVIDTSKKIVEIELHKDDNGLGFNITGGIDEPYIPGYNDFFITRIRPDGAAAKDGRLHVGDRVVAQPSTILPTPVAAATGLMKSESSGRESPDSFSEGNKENGMATSVIIKEDGIQAIDPKNSPRAEVEIESKDEIEHDRDSLVVHGPPEIPVHFVRDNESGKVPRSSKQDNDDDRGSTFSGFPDDVPRTPKRPISILDPASQSVLTEAVFISIGVVALAAGVFLAYRLIKRT